MWFGGSFVKSEALAGTGPYSCVGNNLLELSGGCAFVMGCVLICHSPHIFLSPFQLCLLCSLPDPVRV